jgi:hypothetical protein
MTTIRLSSDEWTILKKDLIEKLGLGPDASINSITTRISARAKDLKEGYIVSSSNLNAIWKKESHKFTDVILNALAQILGYNDWDDYRTRETRVLYNPVDIDVSRLETNQTFTLGWHNKYCVLKYRGEFEFEVLKSVNMRSDAGRIFWTPGFCVDTSNGFEYPNIKLDDGGDGYFEYQNQECKADFDDDYFYL